LIAPQIAQPAYRGFCGRYLQDIERGSYHCPFFAKNGLVQGSGFKVQSLKAVLAIVKMIKNLKNLLKTAK
jgi:hypothetical protein